MERRRRPPGIAPAVGRSVQRRQGLGQTSSPAIEASQRDGIFSREGQPVGGEGCWEDPVAGTYIVNDIRKNLGCITCVKLAS